MEQRVARVHNLSTFPHLKCGNHPKIGVYLRMILNWRAVFGFSTVETPQNVEDFVEAKSYIFQPFKSKKYTFHIFHSDLEKFSVYILLYIFYLIKWKEVV